jgi:hypothetical protein
MYTNKVCAAKVSLALGSLQTLHVSRVRMYVKRYRARSLERVNTLDESHTFIQRLLRLSTKWKCGETFVKPAPLKILSGTP